MLSLLKIFLRLGFFVSLLAGLSAEDIHVAFCLDNDYAEGTGVAAYSLCKNMSPDDEIVLYIVMTEPLKSEHREKFQQLGNLFHKIQVQIHDDERTIQCIAQTLTMPNGWLKLGAYPIRSVAARLVLDKVLPETIHKVIYLDGDTLVFDSLKDLWQKLPRENYAIAGVTDCCRDPVYFPSHEIYTTYVNYVYIAQAFPFHYISTAASWYLISIPYAEKTFFRMSLREWCVIVQFSPIKTPSMLFYVAIFSNAKGSGIRCRNTQL
ncbi:MAG: hypothetical protein LBG98_00795 [Puniceicoccales bacterium]|nr:hypothetical protein [Puniceicoccales bacterium]